MPKKNDFSLSSYSCTFSSTYFFLLLLGLFASPIGKIHAQSSVPGFPTLYIGSDEYNPSRIEPSPRFPMSNSRSGGLSGAFEVSYDPSFPVTGQMAVQAAIDIWGSQIIAHIPIKIRIAYSPFPAGTLAETTPIVLHKNFTGALVPNTYYPSALANQLSGCDLAPLSDDIIINFNSTENWHLDPFTTPSAGIYHMTTVALHEIAQGLGFVGSGTVDDGSGQCLFFVPGLGCIGVQDSTVKDPLIYDRFIENGAGTAITAVMNYSPAMNAALTNALFWNGPAGVAGNAGIQPLIYTPATYAYGLSYSHLDEATFNGTFNSLMTPILATAEVILDPGDILRGSLEDMGWILANTTIPHMDVRNVAYVGMPLAFSDCSSGSPISWFWNFGDANTSISQHPSHTYASIGSYNVTLTLDGNPAYTTMKTVDVYSLPVLPYLNDFESGPDGFYLPSLSCKNWELGSSANPTFFFNGTGPIGGSNSWITQIDAGHGGFTQYELESPPFDFSAVGPGDYFLRLKYRWASSINSGMNVQYSTDGGTTWSILGGLQGVDPNADSEWYNQASITGLGNESGWAQSTITTTIFNPSYRITALVSGFSDVRFRLRFGALSSLGVDGIQIDDFEIQGVVLSPDPIELQLTEENDQVNLFWQSASSVPIESFKVERSWDGQVFASIGEINAIPSSPANYSFVDNHSRSGIRYYRLKLKKDSPNREYSTVAEINIERSQPFLLYPNPAEGKVMLEVTEPGSGKLQFQLFAHSGKKVMDATFKYDGSIHTPISIAHLPTGVYTYQIIHPTEIFRGKFLKKE